jgi:MFS transporter, FHS family, glucose/mannose:H+ symporter
MSSSTARPANTLPTPLVVGGFGTFALIGSLQAMYGPALLSIQTRFGLEPATASLILSAFFAGVVVSILGLGALERIVSRAASLTAALALVGLGSLGVGVGGAWWLVLLSACGIGLGYGLSVLNYNTLFATGFGSRSTAFVNLINAAWSVGAILGPVVIGLTPQDFRAPFIACGLVALLLAPLGLGAGNLELETPARAAVNASSTLPALSLFLGFALVFWLYTGSEVGIGANEPRHLRDAFGYDLRSAAFLSSLFWFGQAAGRVLIAPVSLRVREDVIVVACLALAAVGLGLAHIRALAPFAYAACGVFLGPVFPSVIVWFNRHARGSMRATSLMLAGANLGGVIFPPLIAVLTANASLIPTLLLAFTAANAAFAWNLRRISRA